MASIAEREIRDAVVDWWHRNEPQGRVVHELPLSSMSTAGRADLAVVFPDVLVLIEIKSERDKLTRLEKQFEAMRARGHGVLMVCHDKWFDDAGRLKDQEWMRYSHNEHVWRYPESGGHGAWAWERYRSRLLPHPANLLNLLWVEELRWCYARSGSSLPSSGLTMAALVLDLYHRLTGRQVSELVCAALRARSFAEADPPVET